MFDLDNATMLLMQRCVPFGTRCCRSARCCLCNDVCLRHVVILRYRNITLRQILILRRFVRYFFVQGKLHKKCHTFPSQLPLYFIKYAPSILFLKILKYYNSTILYYRPKKSHFCATFTHSMHIFKYFHTFF